jgi:hypothetical protein
MLLLSWTFSFRRGCQMVYLNTKIPIFGIFWRALEWKILVYYLALWYIWWPFVNFMIFGKFNGHLLNLVNIFVHFLHFGTLYRRKSDNPASKCIVTKSLITKSAPNDSHFFVRICTRKKMSFLIDPEKVIKNMTLVRKTWNYFFAFLQRTRMSAFVGCRYYITPHAKTLCRYLTTHLFMGSMLWLHNKPFHLNIED